MKTRRLQLHQMLCDILGSTNVYFRAPSRKMKYPCILYDLEGDTSIPADNISYFRKKRWSVTVVDEDPDSEIPERLQEMKYCTFDRPYVADGLNHFVHTLYF